MTERFSGNLHLTKEEIISLTKVRIIKINLVHVQGFPQSLANIEKLRKPEYFGQYGRIQKILLTHKINPETNRKSYSAYITYSNEKEAAMAILLADSLLIEGKIIRVFFGTTKYCHYFLDNIPCPNMNKCTFLHQLVKEKDIIIDQNKIFNYDKHLELAKNIISSTQNLKRNIPDFRKTVFPLSEEKNEKYFSSNNISYINHSKKDSNSFVNKNNLNLLRNKFAISIINNSVKNNKDHNGCLIKNNSFVNFDSNYDNNHKLINLINSPVYNEKIITNDNPNDPLILHNIFKNTIKHILSVKPLFIKVEKNIPLKKMELDFFKNELKKNGSNIYILLDGCLDCIIDKE